MIRDPLCNLRHQAKDTTLSWARGHYYALGYRCVITR